MDAASPTDQGMSSPSILIGSRYQVQMRNDESLHELVEGCNTNLGTLRHSHTGASLPDHGSNASRAWTMPKSLVTISAVVALNVQA
mmetsp:Transcript_16078/g.23952  ORF Transcript_16078/g.23952 Transcript_16078/m.23952 type:complete len:86 (+) Transcript_16078:141-398(+)